MVFYVANNDRIGFREIPQFLTTLLRDLPQILSADEISQKAEDRLFPLPVHDPAEASFADDWNAFVQPDLLEHFKSTRDMVESDLRQMRETEEDSFQIEFPLAHADAWINTINQGPA